MNPTIPGALLRGARPTARVTLPGPTRPAPWVVFVVVATTALLPGQASAGTGRATARRGSLGRDQQLEQALKAYRTGRLDRAEAQLRRLASGPLDTKQAQRAAAVLVRLLVSTRRYSEARHLALRMTRQPRTAAEGFALLARVYFLMGSLGRSLRACQTAVKLAGAEPRYRRLLGEILLAYGKPRAASAALRQAERLRPNDAWTLTLLGDASWQRRHLRRAEAYYRRAASLHDGSIWPLLALDRLGTLLLARHDRKGALDVLRQCRARSPKLGCPYTQAALMPPDPTRPDRPETHVLPPHERRRNSAPATGGSNP